MDQLVEALIHGLSDHLTTGHKLGIQFMQDILQVVPLDRLLRVEKA